MKILHCCLAAFYIDNFGYQENMLPKFHKKQGHNVKILASTETYDSSGQLTYLAPSTYINEHDIEVTRLSYSWFLPTVIVRKLRFYSGILEYVNQFKPDIIFLHDIQFLGVRQILRHINFNPDVVIFVDGHTDFGNSARSWLSKYFLHKIIYKYCAKKIEPKATKFWGVTPARVDFFRDVYGIDQSKLGFLELGVDDSEIDFGKANVTRRQIRKELSIKSDDIVIFTGGKIDRRKNILDLINAVIELNETKIHLLIAGEPVPALAVEFDKVALHKQIHSIGWVASEKISKYMMASDIVCFPGTHSVLWEQAIGLGIPGIFRYWNGMTHIDTGNNCIFLQYGTKSEISSILLQLIVDKSKLKDLKRAAQSDERHRFRYSSISRKAIFHKK